LFDGVETKLYGFVLEEDATCVEIYIWVIIVLALYIHLEVLVYCDDFDEYPHIKLLDVVDGVDGLLNAILVTRGTINELVVKPTSFRGFYLFILCIIYTLYLLRSVAITPIT
jgi:hypothetical protein